jgi:hypothetical protein
MAHRLLQSLDIPCLEALDKGQQYLHLHHRALLTGAP